MLLNGFSFWSWFSCIFRFAGFGVTLIAVEWFFVLVLIFMYLQIRRFRVPWMGLHIGPDFLVSSDQHICVLRVALRAAEGFFILVLIPNSGSRKNFILSSQILVLSHFILYQMWLSDKEFLVLGILGILVSQFCISHKLDV